MTRLHASISFLPEWLIMLDCEMTGVVPERDDLLMIAALKLKLEGSTYVEVGEPLVKYLRHEGQPTRKFHKKFLSHIFAKCNESTDTPDTVRSDLEAWLGNLKGTVSLTGDCIPVDAAFLFAKGCASRSDFDDKDKPVPGTFHYEYFDMHFPKQIARTKVGEKFAVEGIDKDNAHDALVDCRNQLLELNAFLDILTK